MPFAVFMLNSALICVLSIADNLFSCMLAYALTRRDFPFSRLSFAIMLGKIVVL